MTFSAMRAVGMASARASALSRGTARGTARAGPLNHPLANLSPKGRGGRVARPRPSRSSSRNVAIVHAALRRLDCPEGCEPSWKDVAFKNAPVFDRSETSTGIAHIGVGGFHRSHQQAYMNELLARDFDAAKTWLYTGVGVMPNDAGMRDYLRGNDWSYPIVARDGADGGELRATVEEVVTIRDMLLAYEDPVVAIEALADPAIKIVSLTITEFGYRVPLHKGDFALIDNALNGILGTDAFDLDSIAEECALEEECKAPTTFGLICAAAALRFERGIKPFTLMSCDNLPENGEVCKKRMTSAGEELVCGGLCAASLDAFVVWIQTAVKYPSTMVDRITPATSWEDIATLPERCGIEDEWPVMCEPYKHWVIEDNFVDDERPAWETVGAVVVKDVIPHELMKVRLLNVTHSAMCYAGILAGLTHVHEAVTHGKLRAYLETLMRDEISATLARNPGMDPALIPTFDAYGESVLKRFENVAVKDQLDRIAMDGSEKFRVQGRGVVLEGLALGLEMKGFAMYVAAWATFLAREVAEGREVKDAGGQQVTAAFQKGGTGIEAFLDMVDIFGELTAHDGWRRSVRDAHAIIENDGVIAAIDAALGAAPPIVAMEDMAAASVIEDHMREAQVEDDTGQANGSLVEEPVAVNVAAM